MKDMNKFGIGFWIGAGIYSLINMIMNLKNIPQNNILHYNYIITGVAIFGLILNIILLKKSKQKK
jgi:ribose/xylose/arabinose/galactoside ABC-type transport system permease subunit